VAARKLFLTEAILRSQGPDVHFTVYGGGIHAKRSSLGGTGVFANTGFSVYDIIEVCPTFKVPITGDKSRSEAKRLGKTEFWRFYSLQSNDNGTYFISAGLCSFYNHGPPAAAELRPEDTTTPPPSRNVYFQSHFYPEVGYVVYMFAMRNISAGEELLLDYGPNYFDAKTGRWAGASGADEFSFESALHSNHIDTADDEELKRLTYYIASQADQLESRAKNGADQF
jgi:hypothetical protein